MTDHGSPVDDTPPDDVVSAVLDGEGTGAERDLVESTAVGLEQLEQLRRVAAEVARSVPPLDQRVVDTLVARALDAVATPVAPEGPTTIRRLDDQRSRGRHLVRSTAALVAAAAVLVVLVVGVGTLARSSGSSSDSATSATLPAGSDEAAASSAADAGAIAADGSGEGLTAPDLGVVADATAALDRYLVLRDLDPAYEHQFESADLGSGQAAPQTSASPTSRTADACPLPPVAVESGEQWTEVAIAVLPTGPVVLLGNGTTSPASRVLVVDSTTCTVLLDRPI